MQATVLDPFFVVGVFIELLDPSKSKLRVLLVAPYSISLPIHLDITFKLIQSPVNPLNRLNPSATELVHVVDDDGTASGMAVI